MQLLLASTTELLIDNATLFLSKGSNTTALMTKQQQNAGAGVYAPTNAADGPEPVIETYAVQIPRKEYVEIRAPATLPAGYELTVEVDGEHLMVLVVSFTFVISLNSAAFVNKLYSSRIRDLHL
jgi:hypothetical protein